MRLIEIQGNICELTNLQASPYDKVTSDNIAEINEAAVSGCEGCCRGGIRFLADGKIRSKAIAIVEIKVRGLPHNHKYVIYHDKKGFYSIIQRGKVYLKDIKELDGK
jgi:hypothetical protein